MKSYLPLFLLIGGLLVISLVGFAILNLLSKEAQPEEVKQPTPSLPYVTLTPQSGGHELTLSVSKIESSVASLEYELVYNTEAGVLQGIPGSIDLAGQTSITRTLTLGTCSGGVCRYDKGVKDITLTLRLRDENGKLRSKFGTGVALLTREKKLSSSDGKFTLTLDRVPTGFYTILQTGGPPSEPPGEVVSGPYGVFTSGDTKQTGTISLEGGKLYVWDGKSWQQLVDDKTSVLGTFIGIKE